MKLSFKKKKVKDEQPSEDFRLLVKNNWLDRRIFALYQFGIQWMPIILMLTHWYGVWDYGNQPRPIVLDTEQNGNCVIWLYSLAYIYMPLAMLPATYFYKYCWMFRIPFIYFFGINAVRLYYQHWLITPEQLEGHHIIIILTIILYIYGFAKIACERGFKRS